MSTHKAHPAPQRTHQEHDMPWSFSKHTDCRAALIYDADGFEVARVCYPNRDANARLIAAAPDLLAVAMSVLEHARIEMPQALIAAAEMAVAKATAGGGVL